MPEGEGSSLARRIVVGVDGSVGSRKALDWAIAEAIRFPAALELATAWAFWATSSPRPPMRCESRCNVSPEWPFLM